jgi:hypothetical protein
MFKFVVTIEYTDGTVDKNECYSLPDATGYAQRQWEQAKAAGKTMKELVVRSKPWL